MVDLGVELHPVEVAGDVLDGADRGVGGAGDDLETGGDARHVVAVAHPHRAFAVDEEAVEEGPGHALGLQLGMAELALAGRHHHAAEVAGQELHAVADAEDRHAELEELLGNGRGARLVDRLGPAGEDDPLGREGLDRRQLHVEGMQLAVDVGLAHPPGDQLGVLGAEIENEDFFLVDIH